MNKYIKMFLNLFKKKELVSKKGDKFLYNGKILTVDCFIGCGGFPFDTYEEAFKDYKLRFLKDKPNYSNLSYKERRFIKNHINIVSEEVRHIDCLAKNCYKIN